ncbi:MAG: glutamate--tRNA ligase [Peptostreptococcus sp.]|jgi:glutamate--tRNA ligase|uniref:glutamate--tRNA ligase n=1 Tax=Peptostreptococcus sp. TaxID=1262 RepID=UPI001CB30775|nr:glutamate--tRNA ligase [Peptostreptococcus sp.]MBF1044077.1 glutamate--tRNA ligase [Peptostreptococcus sp.]MBF1057760.1 glutamate--tRNA ligase [Peptostreptococcus sp.]
MSKELAQLLFPNVDKTIEYYEELYPERNLDKKAKVTRLGPSPTGFIHLGNLYGALVDERIAHLSQGPMLLRIEDTDDKRKVEGSEELIIRSLKFFGIEFDEGVSLEGEKGIYGPYRQSDRREIYQTAAKYLTEKGFTYPSFVSEEEMAQIREEQEKAGVNTGYYGKWAKDRELTFEEIKDNLDAGKPWTLRLKSGGDPEVVMKFKDGIRGEINVRQNNLDVVILKQNGIPTYHFAHVVDDHFMRVTDVVRGEEWLSTLPIHLELFFVMGWRRPNYNHTAHLMKVEDGKKRKLSKRKDPELSLEYYMKDGYFPEAVTEYLMTLMNSNYEEWRMKNPDKSYKEFAFKTKNMSSSGALFDLNKLKDISKDVLVKMSEDKILDFMISWSEKFDKDANKLLVKYRDELGRLLAIGRSGKKPRKDLVNCTQIMDFVSYYFDEGFRYVDDLPERVSKEDAKVILRAYLDTYRQEDTNEAWFEKVKEITDSNGFTSNNKEFKKEPDLYKGNITDVSTAIRVAVVGRQQSPDLWSIQQVMGYDRVVARIEEYLESLD